MTADLIVIAGFLAWGGACAVAAWALRSALAGEQLRDARADADRWRHAYQQEWAYRQQREGPAQAPAAEPDRPSRLRWRAGEPGQN